MPGVIAGGRMERVIGERGASADRSGAILSLGSAQLHIDLRMRGLRIGLMPNFNAPRLSMRFHRFTMWPHGCKPFRLLWPSARPPC